MYKDKRKAAERQAQSRQVERQLVKLVWPILVKLNEKLDRRLVTTFLGLVMAIITDDVLSSVFIYLISSFSLQTWISSKRATRH